MEPTPAHPCLASAFLALCDGPAVPAQRSAGRVIAASVTALVLALAGPLAWVSAAPDPPVAAQTAQPPSPLVDDEPEA
jgi:hypothetical protein